MRIVQEKPPQKARARKKNFIVFIAQKKPPANFNIFFNLLDFILGDDIVAQFNWAMISSHGISLFLFFLPFYLSNSISSGAEIFSLDNRKDTTLAGQISFDFTVLPFEESIIQMVGNLKKMVENKGRFDFPNS